MAARLRPVPLLRRQTWIAVGPQEPGVELDLVSAPLDQPRLERCSVATNLPEPHERVPFDRDPPSQLFVRLEPVKPREPRVLARANAVCLCRPVALVHDGAGHPSGYDQHE